MMKTEYRMAFFFSLTTEVMTWKESYWVLMRNRCRIRAARRIRKAPNPDRKKKGRMVSRSTIPSKENRNRSTARGRVSSGYKRSAVQMRRAYSAQKMATVTSSIRSKRPLKAFRASKVSRNRTAMLQRITVTIK